MRDLSEFDASTGFERGDLRPLLEKVASGAELIGADRHAIARVLEAAIAGRRSWRDAHRPKDPEAQVRASFARMAYRALRADGRGEKDAKGLVAEWLGLTPDRIGQILREKPQTLMRIVAPREMK